MLFRLSLIALSIGLVVFVVTQIMWPAIVNRPFFPIFRGESRLARAERLNAEARAEKLAAEAEADTIRLDTEAQRIRDEAFNNLVNNAPQTPPSETSK
jgi:hypothetical protein